MQHMPQKTWVAIISDHVDKWRRSAGMSREAVAEMIISEYQFANKARLPGIKDFSNDKTGDIDTNFEARRVNADRIFRWLDDRTKDSTLLPANFIPSVLSAMPDEYRTHCVNELFMQIGFCAQALSSEHSDEEETVLSHLQLIMKEGGEAELAMSRLVDGETFDELTQAEKEIADLIESLPRIQRYVRSRIARKVNGGGKHHGQKKTA
ncbi:hypothetical protein SAMN05216326_12536 [Nitrosomonas marina]|uniref:Phage regulatory protein CII (CP76) n=1 Tax=Nitrosomonas marina TaxID=917 RepID=A0A1I0E6F5_9PROT|nr:hypothetical protein [Nitrosomonas marina]SET40768.1 hypothetical protein SAMN05216326_12536 [Nitrosomonas marina]